MICDKDDVLILINPKTPLIYPESKNLNIKKMIIYEDVLREFHERGVKYLIVGGIAVNLLGSLRSTADLDIIVELSDRNIEKIIGILKNNGYYVKQPVNPMELAVKETRDDWIKNKNLKAFNFYKKEGLEEVDIIIESPLSFEKAMETAVLIKVDDITLPVISAENLIEMKKHAGRAVDKLDIEELKKIKKLMNKK